MSPNVLEEISAMAGQKKWRSDLRPGEKKRRWDREYTMKERKDPDRKERAHNTFSNRTFS